MLVYWKRRYEIRVIIDMCGKNTPLIYTRGAWIYHSSLLFLQVKLTVTETTKKHNTTW